MSAALRSAMAAPHPVLTAAAASPLSPWRTLAVALPHLGALAVMLRTENDIGSRFGFVLAWSLLNAIWIALLRRPALSGALSL